MNKLKNRVALVTGASKGIGAGIAKSLAAEGAAVVVNYASSKEGADCVVAEITGKGGKAVAVQGDVSNASDVQRLFAETKRAFGKLDVLVNNMRASTSLRRSARSPRSSSTGCSTQMCSDSSWRPKRRRNCSGPRAEASSTSARPPAV